MRTEDVLAATAVGVWEWDDVRGVATTDAVSAELLGLPPTRATFPEATLRARFHVEDWTAAQRAIGLARTEGRVGEAELRVVDREGAVLRTVRLRFRTPRGEPAPDPSPPGDLLGTISEVSPALPPPPESDWDERRAREAFVLDTGRALSEVATVEEAVRVLGGLAMPGFAPDAVVLVGRGGGWLVYPTGAAGAGGRGGAGGAGGPRFLVPLDARHPAAEALRAGRAVYLPSPGEYRRRYPDVWAAPHGTRRRAWAYLPLVVAGRTIGVWLAAFGHEVPFTIVERSTLSTIARMLAQALARISLADTERELTADLQHTMRPPPTPSVPGMWVAARYVPTGGGLQVGGDWYDVIPLPTGRVALVIGDVQGHDVRAAAVMAQLRIALRAYASEGHHPDAVLSRASRFLAALTAGTAGDPDAPDDDARFATCLYVEVDPPSGTLVVARAGHLDPAMVLQDGTVVTRPTVGGLPLGLLPQSDYPTTRLVLQPGETLLMCTDGLLEAGGRDVDAGWGRLRKAVAGLSDLRLDDLADTLVETVYVPPPRRTTPPLADVNRDDIALLLLRRPPADRTRPAGDAPVRRGVLTIAQSEPARVSDARRQLGALLHDWTDPERVHGAMLMLSEAVTNVLTHTDGDALLVAEISGRRGERLLRVEVSDPSDELPHPREPGELASSGRGLLLMRSLADAWGWSPRGVGKTTWFELGEEPPDSGG
ncbi:ATP-binding SpoIIE family protein phosphatase [Streptomyces specialis]|uniref:ATP-binding SpoIIE family protein phosphatase n=1 Tax=Streptomyces specialis TaxID=498367 RepID=UPI00073E3869|nr:SpoIIE family protein phosphatase [Streptomyces specialis]